MSNETKNILFLTNLPLWSMGEGKGGRAFINTVKGYKNAGWTIWLITSGGGVPGNLIDNDKLYETSHSILDKLWISKIRILSVFARYIKMFLLNSFYIKKGKEVLKDNKETLFIIYAYEIDAVYAAKRLSKAFNYPLITRFQGTIHNNTPDNFSNKIRKAPCLQAYKTAADLTIMTNDGTQGLETLKRYGNKSKEVLFWRNGVTTVPIETLKKREALRSQFCFEDEFTFLAVSRLVSWKKVDRAINAFLIVQKKYPHSRLVIIGDGDEKNDLIKLTIKLGLDKKVYFLGAVEQNIVSSYMVAADAFLSFYDFSNVGNPLMESMMCGKPLITLDVGDTGKIIKNGINGVLLSQNDFDKIPNAMCKVIEDVEFSNKIANGALNFARNNFWSWDERISSEIRKVELLIKKPFIK